MERTPHSLRHGRHHHGTGKHATRSLLSHNTALGTSPPSEPEKSKPSRPSIKHALTEKQGNEKERAKILIVDDNKTNLLILAEILKALGFSPITAQSGSEALELLKHIQPDLAIFDIRMDGMSGWDLIKHIQQKKNHAALPVIAISADDAPQTIAPFKAWLRRPIEADTLYELLTSCLADSTLARPKSQ